MNKNHNPEVQQAINCLRLTLPRMQKHDVPTTPQNYAVWYEYTLGSIGELNQAIDEILKTNSLFTAEINKELYDKYIADRPIQVLESVHDSAKNLVQQLILKIHTMQTGTDRFSGAIDDCQNILASNPDIKTLDKLVTNLVNEAQKVQESNKNMADALAETEKELESLKCDMEKLNAVALVDQLTGVGNRRAFEENIEQLFQQYDAEDSDGSPFTIVVTDIDHFKAFNDTHGHQTGDRVLSYVALCIKRCIRGSDAVFRYGGEEFVISLPNTDIKGGKAVAENIRSYIANKKLTVGDGKKVLGRVTSSFGIAEVQVGDTIESLFERADQALYQAKENGRNCVVCESEIKSQ